MRRLVAIVTLLAALAAATATASPAATGTPTTFVLAGGGWGHGVGMSQWGAFGQAKAGRGFEQILQHYYRGTELGSAPAAVLDRVRVLVGNGLASVAFTNAIAVFDGEGKRHAAARATGDRRREARAPGREERQAPRAGRPADLPRRA